MTRRRLLLALKAIVSMALLGWVVHTALARDGIDALGARLAELSPAWLLVAAAVQMAAVFLGIARWRELLEAHDVRLPFGFLVRSYLMGRFVGTFTPSTAGLDAYRAWDVARETGRRGAAAGVLVTEKLIGLLGLSLACVTLLPFGASRLFGDGALPVAVCIGAGSVAGLVIVRRPTLMARPLALLPTGLEQRAGRLLGALGARGLDAPVIGRAVLLSLCSHMLTSAVFVTTALALGLTTDPVAVLVVGNAIVVATLLPVSVGGVGVREGVAVALLGTVAVSATDATLVALLGYLVGQVPGIVGGLLSLTGSREPTGVPAGARAAQAP